MLRMLLNGLVLGALSLRDYVLSSDPGLLYLVALEELLLVQGVLLVGGRCDYRLWLVVLAL